MLLSEMQDKKIAVWGLGREGKSVLKYLKNNDLFSLIIDEGNEEEVLKCDIVIKSPGVSFYKDIIGKAKEKGVKFSSLTNIFLSECLNLPKRPKLIAITGTKGKSTTSALVACFLESLGNKVFLGGNFGTPLLEALENIETYDYVVAEISSYQATDLEKGFDVALINNLYPEHLNWHTSHERYYQDKLNLIRKSELKIVNALDNEIMTRMQGENLILFNDKNGIHIENKSFLDGDNYLFDTVLNPLAGEHNLLNICGALTVLKVLGLPLDKLAQALESFKPLPHRLEVVEEKDGITFVDDSISTTPETAIAGLKVFADKPVTLIAGGFDRGQDYAELALEIKRMNAKLVALPDTGSRIVAELNKLGEPSYKAEDMETALQTAKEITPSGGVVLLSPAAPSYNLFKNFEERGNVFKSLI